MKQQKMDCGKDYYFIHVYKVGNHRQKNSA